MSEKKGANILHEFYFYYIVLEMVNLGPARGPKRADKGLAGPENPGPLAFTGRNGPNDFYFKIPLLIVRWALGSNKGIINCFNL